MSSSFANIFSRLFPTPKFIFPRAAGVDVSDTSIKWLAFDFDRTPHRIIAHGEEAIDPGILGRGIIQNEDALVATLSALRKKLGGITCVHAALPEEAAYVFSLHVPAGNSREQTQRMIEFELEGRVPIPASAAVYDFDVICESEREGSLEVGVTVFPRDIAESYAHAFDRAGFTLLSLEVEASSIGRVLTSGEEGEPVTLVADFGRARTGFAVIKHGVPIFTSTVEIGGNSITQALEKELDLSGPDIQTFTNEQGLLAEGGALSKGVQAITNTASALADEITRHYNYWDTRRNEHGERLSPVGRVILVGGSSNLRGLPEYIAGRVQAPVTIGEIWHRVFSLDDYIPPIDRRLSLEYATAAGLALRGF
ncbi:MAG TPA: pilus assembly protein PilM [Candidatus Paceibacterota bacterium]|nr:pilus assembly protein PilM [Candidatus Paceibacterota bacterium]